MTWMNWKHAAAVCIAALCMTLAAPAYAAKRVALVIGNNDYKFVPKLQKAVNEYASNQERGPLGDPALF